MRNIRLPRTLVGLLVGMNLAVSGVLLQGIIRNLMASPNIIGVNAGAGLAAVVVMALFPSRIGFIPPASFIGPGSGLTISALGNSKGVEKHHVYIVLAGVAVSNLLNAEPPVDGGLQRHPRGVLPRLLGSLWKKLVVIRPDLAVQFAGPALVLFLSPEDQSLQSG